MSKKTSFQYLLDTNILSELVRNPQGTVAQKISEVGDSNVCTSIIIVCELRFGVEKRGSKRLAKQVEEILFAIEILPYQTPADNHYGELRNYLEKAGTPIGPNDLLIASHALTLGLTLVTANVREFSRVPGLLVENWREG